MSLGIKETSDLFLLLKECAEAIVAAKADGKVDFRDALSQETRDLIPAAIAMVKGSESIALELKDLDQAEIKALVDMALAAGAALVGALVG